MKKRFLSIIIISTLSISLLVGCNKSTDISNNTDSTINFENEKNTFTDSSTEDSNGDVMKNEDKIQDLFTSAIDTLYNTDYSLEENKSSSIEFINNKFTKEGSENIIKNINSYNSTFNSSDLVITNIKEIKPINNDYLKAYEVSYNVTITSGKPSAYSDLVGVVVEDKNSNLFIHSLNENNF